MTLANWNAISSVPKWAPHRKGLTVVDNGGVAPIAYADLSKAFGVKADGFRWVHVRWRETTAGVTALSLRPLFADDDSEQWIADANIAAVDMSGVSTEFSFEARGCTFIIAVTAITPGAGDVAIDVSGFGRYSV